MNLSVPTKKKNSFILILNYLKLTKMKNFSIAAVLFLIIYSITLLMKKKMSNLEYNSDTQLYNAAMSYLKTQKFGEAIEKFTELKFNTLTLIGRRGADANRFCSLQ